MFNTRINKMGKQQIQAAEKIIICHDNPYFVAKYGALLHKYVSI